MAQRSLVVKTERQKEKGKKKQQQTLSTVHALNLQLRKQILKQTATIASTNVWCTYIHVFIPTIHFCAFILIF